ncbi:MAG: hypothetical protein R3F49_09285 [Planctomycetota bacterium]
MRPTYILPLLVPAFALAAAASLSMPANGVGDPLPEVELEGFSQTGAKSIDDLAGRALLIEFFAYW